LELVIPSNYNYKLVIPCNLSLKKDKTNTAGQEKRYRFPERKVEKTAKPNLLFFFSLYKIIGFSITFSHMHMTHFDLINIPHPPVSILFLPRPKQSSV
jgi:hypothetical protein